jgi:hypothetical protein
MRQECTNGIRNRDVSEQLRLGNEATARGMYRKSTVLEISKRIARCTVGLQRMKDLTLWRGRPPPKRKIAAHTGAAGNVEAPAPTISERINRTLSVVARDNRT